MFDGSQYQDVSKNRQSASGLVKWLFALAFSGLVLLSMACGDSDEAATAAPETTVPTHRPTQASEIGQGRRVEPTGSEYQGRIESGDRYQRFYFRAERGQTYIVRTSLGSLDDTEISVYGPDGSRIAYNDDFPDGRASRLNFRALEQGTYEIRVAGYDGQTGSYGLFLSMGSSPSNRGSSRSGSSDSGPTPSTYGVGVKSVDSDLLTEEERRNNIVTVQRREEIQRQQEERDRRSDQEREDRERLERHRERSAREAEDARRQIQEAQRTLEEASESVEQAAEDISQGISDAINDILGGND